MGIAVSVVLLVAAFVAAGALAAAALRMPAPRPGGHGTTAGAAPAPRHTGRVRLMSRLLFARRSLDAITLDCTLVAVDGGLPAAVDPPEGLPFALRVRCPDTAWLANRVEKLLSEWADDNRELVLELTADRDKVRTTIASGRSSVHLELADAAGPGRGLSAA